jgi:hypothetical protein
VHCGRDLPRFQRLNRDGQPDLRILSEYGTRALVLRRRNAINGVERIGERHFKGLFRDATDISPDLARVRLDDHPRILTQGRDAHHHDAALVWVLGRDFNADRRDPGRTRGTC